MFPIFSPIFPMKLPYNGAYFMDPHGTFHFEAKPCDLPEPVKAEAMKSCPSGRGVHIMGLNTDVMGFNGGLIEL